METKLTKWLLQPTHPNQLSISSDIKVCKLLLSSEINPVYSATSQQNSKLKEKLICLEWEYARQLSAKSKICASSTQNQLLTLSPTQIITQIEKLRQEVDNLRSNSSKLSTKVIDRQESIVQDEKYWRKLRIEKEQKQKAVEKIKSQNQKLLSKKEKMDFLRKQILRNQSINYQNFDSISRQKTNIKQKLVQKFHTLKRKHNQLENKTSRARKNLEKAEEESYSLSKNLSTLQRKLQHVVEQKQKQMIIGKKMERDILEQQNNRYELEQKLKIHKQRLSSMKQTQQRLEEYKSEIENATRQFVQIQCEMQSQIKRVESGWGFQIEHVLRLLSIQ